MSSKEALRIIERYVEYSCDKEFEIVFQDLNRLEKLEKVATKDCIAGEQVGLNIINGLIERGDKYKQENLKLKNAIEVLKKELCFEFYEPSKSFDFYAINLKLHKDDDDYTTIILDSDEKDEFFALKEVLGNEK